MSNIFYVTITKPIDTKLPTYLQIINKQLPKPKTLRKSQTTTYKRERPNNLPLKEINKDDLIEALKTFREHWSSLYEADRHSLYRTFPIPKKNGGTRWINAPDDRLKSALTDLKEVMEHYVGTEFHHDSAYAYVKERCPVSAVKRHQANNSKWFAKYDFSNFFGSVTLDFTIRMCSMIYPLNEICATERGKHALRNAFELAFLDGGLPQGTPVSPWITNFIMIPFDHSFSAWCNKYSPHFCYTRYADDICISCEKDFNYRKVEQVINSYLHEYDAPFRINAEKTHYGSREGHNFILGVCLNKDNCITIGHKRKKAFEATLFNYAKTFRSWELDDVRKLQGIISYYLSIEKESISRLLDEYNSKTGMNIQETIKRQLKGEL